MSEKYWEIYFDAIKNQNFEKALDTLNSILKTDSKNPQVHLKIGDIFQKTGDMSRAISAYQQSAWLLMNGGFLQKALAVFKIILRLDPYNAEAVNKAKTLMMEIEGSRIKPAPAIVSAAEEISVQETAPAFEQYGTIKFEGENEQEVAPEPPAETIFGQETIPEIESGLPLNIPEFLSFMPEEKAKQFIEKIEPQLFSQGQAIIEEGDSGDSIFVIISGHAKVVAHILNEKMELATLSAGDVFGEVAFLTGRPRTASVIAADTIEVLELDKQLLEKIFEQYPGAIKTLEDFYHSHVQDTLKKVKARIKK